MTSARQDPAADDDDDAPADPASPIDWSQNQPAFILKWKELKGLASKLLKLGPKSDPESRAEYDATMRKVIGSVGLSYEDCVGGLHGVAEGAMAFDMRMKILLQVTTHAAMAFVVGQ